MTAHPTPASATLATPTVRARRRPTWWRAPRRSDLDFATRDASLALTVAIAALILRLPLSVVLVALLSVVVLAWNGIRVPRATAAPLWAFMLLGLGSSLVAWSRLPDPGVWGAEFSPIPLVNNATVMVVMMALTAAITTTQRQTQVLKRVMDGIVLGLWAVLGLAAFEVISGIKLLPILYPEGNTVDQISQNRLIVASIFPNYNDFSVAMAIFGTVLTAQLLLGAGVSRKVRAARIGALAFLSFLIVVIGSRGALMALVIGIVIVVVTTARVRHRGLVSVPMLVLGLTGVTLAGLLASQMPFFTDPSSLRRVGIIRDTLAMMPPDRGYFWHGFASPQYFSELAAEIYGPVLMNPHNMLLEIASMYGIPTLIAFVVLWIYVLNRGLWLLRIATGWREVSAVTVTALMPIIGVVPSSTMRYYWVYPFLAASISAFQLYDTTKRRRSDSPPVVVSETAAGDDAD
ncbi:O-antigen ligase family protein [Aestuariimicrobium soli]|uniref:O-antigen ligase family protein n=1 Tax=Aestuariimicrobium soli TaxID=2035834 RepID=UPI003EB82D7E